MSKLNLTLSSVLFLIMMGVGLLIWRISLLFTDFATILADLGAGSDSELAINTTSQEEAKSLNESHQITENSSVNNSFGHYETIDETIARIKRDVQVTGAILGAHGQEKAFFQIEGMPDRSFKINTQLMDGFIITAITHNHVVLKNQSGDETFSLSVR